MAEPDPYRSGRERLEQSVLEGPGHTDAALRARPTATSTLPLIASARTSPAGRNRARIRHRWSIPPKFLSLAIPTVTLCTRPPNRLRARYTRRMTTARTARDCRGMVQFVEDRAREMGLEVLLALSTQAFNFFRSKAGFTEGDPEDLPPARRERYEQSGRRSRVLVKALRAEPRAAQPA